MISEAAYSGVFQVESRAKMRCLARPASSLLLRLVIEVAIVRPGPIHPPGICAIVFEPRNGPKNRLRPIEEMREGWKNSRVPLFQERR